MRLGKLQVKHRTTYPGGTAQQFWWLFWGERQLLHVSLGVRVQGPRPAVYVLKARNPDLQQIQQAMGLPQAHSGRDVQPGKGREAP